MDTIDLQSACKTGNLLKIQEALFRDGSKINEKDTQLGWTPLYRTVISGKIEAAKFLLEQGADPNSTNNFGETALHQAADSENYSMAILLLQFKAKVNIQQNEGDTPLHHSAFRGDLDMIKLLLGHGGDPNIKNRVTGRSALHYAIDCGYLECVEAMINAGADPQIKDLNNKSGFDMTSDEQITSILSKKKPEVGVSELAGDTLSEKEFEKILEEEPLSSVKVGSKEISHSVTAVSSIKNYKSDIFPIFDWLEQHSLALYYELLRSLGYYSIEDLLSDPEGLKTKVIPKIGKPGHKDRFIFRLSEEGFKKSAKVLHKKSKSYFLRCCGNIGSGTPGFLYTPDLKKWLSEINMDAYYKNFVDFGYDDIDALILMVDSQFGLSKEKLKEIGVINDRHVLRVLRKLDKDNANIYNRNSVGRVSFDEPKSVSCESCLIA